MLSIVWKGRAYAYNLEHGYTDLKKKHDRRQLSDAYHRIDVVHVNIRHFPDTEYLLYNDFDHELEANIENYY